MINEKISTVLDELNIKIKDIAALADIDPASFSRLKSGARTPAKNSKTLRKFADATILYCEQNGKIKDLDALIEYKDGDRYKCFIQWLFPETEKQPAPSFSSYKNKLNACIELADISNSRLARLTNTDASYISRIRNGTRTPRANATIAEAICSALYESIKANGKLNKAKVLADIQADENSADFYYEFRNWLCDFRTDDLYISKLLTTLDTFEIPKEMPSVTINAQELEKKEAYYGNEGLQLASLRFLTEAAQSDTEVIYLYSDQDIDWMTQDREYAKKWAALMYSLINKGIKIKIIHNIDRSLPDMLNAISSWLPLYMTCGIEPYYINTKREKRFSHTLFICPGTACIYAFNIAGEKHTMYNYITKEEHITFYSQMYLNMLDSALPLVFTKQAEPNDAATEIETDFNNIPISDNGTAVTVTRLNIPTVSFEIHNHLLANAIRAYCSGSNKGSREKAGEK